MITLPAVPFAVNVFTVCVVHAVKFCFLPALILKSLNVLEPLMIIAKLPVVAFQKLLNTNPPELNVLFHVLRFAVIFIVDVHAFNVRFVMTDISKGFANQVASVHVQLPIVIDLTLEFDETSAHTVTSKLFASKFQLVIVKLFVVQEYSNLSQSVTVQLTQFIVRDFPQRLPALVSVLLPLHSKV